jgi:protein SCO1
VVIFGDTHCPDLCPTTLADMARAMRRLGGDAARVQVVFVTLDPERDTRERLAQYVPSFYPGFLGLYGDAAQIARAARDFGVFYQEQAGGSPGDYDLEHTAGSFVLDPQGELRLFLHYGVEPEKIAADIRRLLD